MAKLESSFNHKIRQLNEKHNKLDDKMIYLDRKFKEMANKTGFTKFEELN